MSSDTYNPDKKITAKDLEVKVNSNLIIPYKKPKNIKRGK